MVKSNTAAVIRAIRKNDFDILVHPGEKIKVDITAVAEEASKKNILLEINNSHKHLSAKDLEMIKNIDVRMVINSDAHNCSQIGDYDRAVERIRKSGTDFENVINLEV